MNGFFKYILECDVMQTPLHIGTRSTVCIGGVVGHMTFKGIAVRILKKRLRRSPFFLDCMYGTGLCSSIREWADVA